jgi:hypothetical protein
MWSSEILRSISGVLSSGISTGEKLSGLGLPPRAQRALQQIDLSPRLMLSSLLEVERAGRVTPMTSADSRRVDTEERRRWWELRFGCEREEMEFEDECEDEKGISLKEEKESEGETEIETLREWERE